MNTLTNYKHFRRFTWLLLVVAVLLCVWRFHRADTLLRRVAATQFSGQHYYTLWTDSNHLADTERREQAFDLIERDSDRIASEAENAREQADDIDYYLHVHDVKDEGFEMIAAYKPIAHRRADSLTRLSENIALINGGTDYRIEHNVRYLAANPVTPPNVRILADGTYTGQLNKQGKAEGHGHFQGNDGSYYEGNWHDGVREGFGFAVVPNKSLRAGEWKDDKYLGERVNYHSERIYGIDISKYQHFHGIGKKKKIYPIHWNRMRITHLGNMSNKKISGTVDYPVSFIFIKSTEGSSVKNPYYAADYRAARRRGMHVGTYHFFSVRTGAASQAHYFLANAYLSKGDLPPVLDVEPTRQQIEDLGGVKELFARIRTWLKIVEQRAGVKPILYVNQTFVNRYLPEAPDIKRNYRVWIARYGDYKPDVRLAFWQLCPDGRVSGITGNVDINVFNGYRDKFDDFLKNQTIR